MKFAKAGRQGKKKVFVAMPGFTVDCLETIDEIGRESREAFLHAGGEALHACPCLNDHPAWIEAMAYNDSGRRAGVDLTMNDLRSFLDAAKEAAIRAAEVLDSWRRKFQVKEKGRFDLVTEADLASQRAIQSYLSGLFPDHAFLGEEEGASKSRPGPDAPPTWIIDPIDGTTNYVHDYPFYCISIGLQVAGELVVGVVYNPAHKEMFAAAKATAPGSTTSGSTPARRRRSAKRCSRPGSRPTYEATSNRSNGGAIPARPGPSPHRFDRAQSRYVAAGRFDGYWAFDNHVWDVAGGTVLVAEAGGVITNIDGSPYDPYTPDALASNGPLHPAMLAIFRKGLGQS